MPQERLDFGDPTRLAVSQRSTALSGLLVALALFLVAALPRAAAGEAEDGAGILDLSLEQLLDVSVFGASRFEQSISDAPSFVSVIGSEEIRRNGYRSLAAALTSLAGFLSTTDRSYWYAGIRGFGQPGDWNSRVLLLVDGHRVNENLFDSVLLGTEAIVDIDLVDRIEFIRGPSSSIYGDNAFFGVINVRTIPADRLRGGSAAGEAGSFGNARGRLSYGHRFTNGVTATVWGSWQRNPGQSSLYFKEFDAPATNGGRAEGLDRERAGRLFGELAWRNLRLQGAFVGRSKKVPTAGSDAAFNDGRYENRDDRGYLDLKIEPRLGPTTRLAAHIYFDHMNYGATFPYLGADSATTIINRDLGQNQWFGGEAQIYRTFGGGLKVIAGGEFQQNTRQRLENHDEVPYAGYVDIERRTTKWAAFAQAERRVAPGVTLNAGVRYDRFDTFGGTVNPRAALIARPGGGATFKALYGRAFRAPNNNELYYDVPDFGIKANPGLDPEEITSYELVYEQALGAAARLTVAAYDNGIRHLIAYTQDPEDELYVYANLGRVDARGLDAELELRGPSGTRGRLSYSLQRTRDLGTGEVLANSPQHVTKGHLSVPLPTRRTFLTLEGQSVGARKSVANEDHGATPVPPYFVLNASLLREALIPGLDLEAGVYNLLNRAYGDPPGPNNRQAVIPRDGRTFRFGLNGRF